MEQVIEGSDPQLLVDHQISVVTEGLVPGTVKLSLRREHVVMSHALAWELVVEIGRKIGADIEHGVRAYASEVQLSEQAEAEVGQLFPSDVT